MARSRTPSFRYDHALRALVEDVVARVPDLGHIRVGDVAFSFSRARVESHGQYAKIIPFRFEGGGDVKIHRKRRFQMPPVVVEGKLVLYAIYTCMPKFQNLPLEQKLLVLLHELYHISPAFNGDIRRFPGRNYAHGPSRQSYDAHVTTLVDRYLASEPDPERYAFLIPAMMEWEERYGAMTAIRIPSPRLIPLDPVRRHKAT